MSIQVTFLRDIEHGGPSDQPLKAANILGDYINAAQASLRIAIYDFRLDPNGPLFGPVVNALKNRAAAGVEIKIAYDQGKARASGVGISPAPTGTDLFLTRALQGTRVETKSITDRNPMHFDPRLMHNKYIIRDAGTPNAAVLTGSTNFTDDSWSFEENAIVQIASPDLAKYYQTDFEELWSSGDIESTGTNDLGMVTVDGVSIDVEFSPGEGARIDQRVAQLIASARQRIKIASMLISSHAILGALQNAMRSKQVSEFAGIYDSTQMEQTIENWTRVPKNEMYIPMFQELATRLASKVSVPYTPTSKHNYMHIKSIVCDDNVFTGSYNLSHSATMNAENTLIIHDRQIADQYSNYIDQLIRQYGRERTSDSAAR
jgi:phosphatidylserine/phosphatidylglycerophosphate/cardiolipin synthase-like enzyme